MKPLKCTLLVVIAVLLVGLFSINVPAEEGKSVEPRSDAAPDEWEFVMEVYGWIATIEATSAGGLDVEFDFETILENLDITFMSVLGVRKNRWAFMVDVIYLDIEDTSNTILNPDLQLTSKGMQDWIVNPFVSYEILVVKKATFSCWPGRDISTSMRTWS